MTTTTTATTLAAAYAIAAEALAEAEARAEAAQSVDYPGSVDGDAAVDAAIDAAAAVVDAAEAVRDAARDAYRESDEPRMWSTSDGGGTVDVECSPSELEDVVSTDWSDCWDDDAARGTWWCHVTCHCEATGETEHVRVEIAPVEPDCDDEHEDHDWRQRHVVGNGGGVIVTEVCRHCGQRRITNTWAQDAHDGTQGHTAISYESPDEDESEDD
jgi:hypothetical protein